MGVVTHAVDVWLASSTVNGVVLTAEPVPVVSPTGVMRMITFESFASPMSL